MKKNENTKKRGNITLFVYPEKGGLFTGVCLEFDIVKEGKTFGETMDVLKNASIGYLETVIEKKLSDNLLNTPAPAMYWKKYNSYLEIRARALKELREKNRKATKKADKAVTLEDLISSSKKSNAFSQDVPYINDKKLIYV